MSDLVDDKKFQVRKNRQFVNFQAVTLPLLSLMNEDSSILL